MSGGFLGRHGVLAGIPEQVGVQWEDVAELRGNGRDFCRSGESAEGKSFQTGTISAGMEQMRAAVTESWRGGGKMPVLACVWVTLAQLAWGHDTPTTKLTWTREISRTVTERCVGCHQPGGAAPFSLRTYAEARPWAVAIKEEVLRRRMPPWPAAKGFGEFANDISLPQEEINRLAEWAEGGAPEGDSQYLRPVFSVPLWRAAGRPAGREVRLEGKLLAATTVLAVRGVGKGKAWAELGDGSVVPLAWLTGEGKAQWLIYRKAVRLPAGAVFRGIGLDALIR